MELSQISALPVLRAILMVEHNSINPLPVESDRAHQGSREFARASENSPDDAECTVPVMCLRQ